MNSFGLGLVLNFTDNASAGMSRVSQTFNQMNGLANQMVDVSDSAIFSIDSLTAAGMGLSIVGEQLSSVGESIVSMFAGISQTVIDTGMTMQGFRMQLQALYGEDSFEQKLQDIQIYAKNSVFDVKGLTSAIVTMKAVGIEAMDAVTTSSGNTTQTLLDYASDIAAMFPNMRNAYGTGVKAAMGALKEYIAEGNVLSLKRGAGLDILGILGEDKGATMEERARQVADLVEILGIAGYTAALVGTPTQQLAKMEDILFNAMSAIADSGVFERYTLLLTKAADWLNNLAEDTDRYNAVISLLGGAITTVLTPLEKLLDYAIVIADSIIDWAISHEKLAQTVIITVAAIGALLVVGGKILSLGGSFFMVTASLMQMSHLASNGISIFNVFGRSIGIFASKFLPIIGIAALIYTAWSKNLFGIRDVVTQAFTEIVDTLKLVFDAFGDNTLSEESFNKAREMGILPLIETILDLKYRFDFFKQGFVQGWTEISGIVVGVVGTITSALSGTIFEPIIDKITGFFSRLSETDTESWFSVGASIAKLGGIVALLAPVVKIVTVLFSKVQSFIPFIKYIFSLITGNPVVAIILAVIGVLVALYQKCEEFRNFVDDLFSTIGGIFQESLGTVFEALKTSLYSLLPTLVSLKNSFMSFLPQVGELIKQIAMFLGNLLVEVAELVASLLPTLVQLVTVLLSSVFKLMPVIMDILTVVMDLIISLLPVILDLIDMLMPFVVELIDMLVLLVDNVLTIVIGLLEVIVPIISELIALIMPMLIQILDALMPIISSLMSIVNMMVARLMPVIQSLTVIVSAILKMAINLLAPIIKLVMQIVEVLLIVLLPVIDAIIVVLGFVIDFIMGIVQVVMSAISTIVVVVTGIINVIIAIIDVIIQAIMVAVGYIVGVVKVIIDTIVGIIKGIVAAVQTVWDIIVTIFSGALDFFTGVFSAVFDAVTGIFQGIANFFTDMWNGVVKAFTTIGDTISGAVGGAINTVLEGAVGIINGFIKAINFAVDVINTIPGVSITKLSLLEVPRLAEGGVVDKPTLAEIGEDGKEAVVPLQNNTEWIDEVAKKVAPRLANEQAQQGLSVPSKGEVNNDYSVTFEAGSIVIQLSNATDAELEKAAEKLMKIIERKQQLKAMATRA